MLAYADVGAHGGGGATGRRFRQSPIAIAANTPPIRHYTAATTLYRQSREHIFTRVQICTIVLPVASVNTAYYQPAY